jgi:hypothetical protein
MENVILRGGWRNTPSRLGRVDAEFCGLLAKAKV